jgi:PAS domain S-box-containing protein
VRDNPENVAFLRAFIESGYQLADAESVEIDRDGNAKYFRNNFTGHIENGAVVRAWGTQRDVTEQRRVEIALREREGHLSAIVRNVNVGIAEMDREGRFAFVNEQFCRLLGRSAEELRGMRMEGVTHPEDIPRNVEFIRALAARGGEDVIEKRYLRPDGTSVWARVVATVQRDESGAVTGMVGMIRDISAARAAEDERAMLLAAAQASEQRAMFLAGASAILGSSLDSDAMLTALADFIAKRFADACIIVVNGENGRIRRASGKAAVDTRLEIEMTIREGETQIGDGLAVVPVVAHAHVLGAIAFLRQQPFDDADLRIANDLGRRAGLAFDNARVYRELDRANRAKDDFLAILSHEMRTPMTAILGWASMLQIGSMSDETTRTAVDTIVQSTRAQAKLIDDLLDVSRIVTGKMQIAMQPISVHSPLAAAVETVRPAAEAKQIAIHIDDAAAGAQVSGDAARLQQVFWNILSNAVKFTPRFGAIDIAVSATEEGVLQVVVRDDGDGIDPDFLPYLFDRFRQADSTATRKHGGLGLGLSIARNLTELHGGTLHAESEGIGKGASFRVTLPLVAPSTAAIKPSRVRREAEIPLDGMRILLVEDDDATRTMLEAALRRYGADARSVSNVGDAMATLDGSDFDVVLSDIGLPGEDGYALLQKIRRSGERLRKLPAVALTAYARGGDRERAIAAGFQSYLAKPVDPAKLAEELRRVAITPPAS